MTSWHTQPRSPPASSARTCSRPGSTRPLSTAPSTSLTTAARPSGRTYPALVANPADALKRPTGRRRRLRRRASRPAHAVARREQHQLSASEFKQRGATEISVLSTTKERAIAEQQRPGRRAFAGGAPARRAARSCASTTPPTSGRRSWCSVRPSPERDSRPALTSTALELVAALSAALAPITVSHARARDQRLAPGVATSSSLPTRRAYLEPRSEHEEKVRLPGGDELVLRVFRERRRHRSERNSGAARTRSRK